MNTEKYIQSIKDKVKTKIDKLRDEANEAYLSWVDTGYQRYMAKKDWKMKQTSWNASSIQILV